MAFGSSFVTEILTAGIEESFGLIHELSMKKKLLVHAQLDQQA